MINHFYSKVESIGGRVTSVLVLLYTDIMCYRDLT